MERCDQHRHASLGFDDPEPIALRSSVRTAGATEPLWAASAADVVPEVDPGDVASRLTAAIDACWERL